MELCLYCPSTPSWCSARMSQDALGTQKLRYMWTGFVIHFALPVFVAVSSIPADRDLVACYRNFVSVSL